LQELKELYPYNFLAKTNYRVHQADNGKNIITKVECSPVTRTPIDQKYPVINRFTMVRPSAGPGFPDALLTQDPVANGDYTDEVGEFKGIGINNLSEEDMDALLHKKWKKYCSK
jgi:hypothetical protein